MAHDWSSSPSFWRRPQVSSVNRGAWALKLRRRTRMPCLVHVFERSGHQTFFEEPERFVEVVRAWMARSEASAQQ